MNDKVEKQGKAITLPNGELRVEFIRNSYYTNGVHTEGVDASRSTIKTAINEMLAAAGRENEQIPYQIVFAATKTVEDPRVAAGTRAAERAEAKKARDEEKAAEKAKKAAEKAAAVPAPVPTPAPAEAAKKAKK